VVERLVRYMNTGPVYLNEDCGLYHGKIPRKHVVVRNDPNTQRVLLEDPEGWQVVLSYDVYSKWLSGEDVSSSKK
jgi:hypothetical protein